LFNGIKSLWNWPFGRLNVWPVVQRELREGARRPVNHRLRIGSGLIGSLLFWIVVRNSDELGTQVGAALLATLHSVLLLFIFVVIPVSAADCIAREHRDGTMGLLFLTPLSAGGIVAGKVLVQGLRALTLWLALVPLLAVPFLAGGVGWTDALIALSLEFSVALLCLGAGMLASSLARERTRAILLAYTLAALVLSVFGLIVIMPLFMAAGRDIGGLLSFGGIMEALGIAIMLVGGLFGEDQFGWNWMAGTRAANLWATWKTLCWVIPILAVLIFILINRFAAARLRRSWQDKPASIRKEKLRRRFCVPIFTSTFKRHSRWSLGRNPIAWLQQYSWKARLTKWLLCGGALVICLLASSASNDALVGWISVLLVILGLFYVVSGVGGFMEEKRSGALELLLVTPLPARKLIFGRVWGLWKQFSPAALVLAGFYWDWHGSSFVLRPAWSTEGEPPPAMVCSLLFCVFLTLPVFATYSALRVKWVWLAVALTAAALFLPFALAGATITVLGDEPTGLSFLLALIVWYGVFVWLACRLLQHSLARRIYAF